MAMFARPTRATKGESRIKTASILIDVVAMFAESLAVFIQADVMAMFARPTLATKGESRIKTASILSDVVAMFVRPTLTTKGQSGRLA